jgi:NitT/TauT family transport system substrate-binding protein
MSRKRYLRFGGLAVLWAFIAPVYAAQPELTKLTVGYSPISAATLPFFIALEERLFQKQGLDVVPVFFGGSPLINAAIMAGEFPIGLTGGAGIISSQLAGSDLTVIGSYLQVLTIDGMAKPEIKSINDLKGKKVAVSRIGASTYFAGLSMLDSRGMKPTDVVFIQAGGVGESFAALANGAVDAAMIGYPFSLKAKQAGFQILFRPPDTEYGLYPNATVAARESWLKEPRNRKIAVSFLRAMNEGLHLSKTDAVASKKALRRYTRVRDEATLQGTFEFFQPYFPANLRTIEKAMANAIKFLDHPKAKQLDPKQTFNNSYVDEALK